MTTCNDVFDLAMGLMDEVDQDRIETLTVDTKEYRARTPFIIETLLRELYYASDTFNDPRQPVGKRPIPPYIISSGAKITNANIDMYMKKQVDLDDFIARTVLPYGLAAHLLLQEDVQSASFFQQRYEELLRWYRSSIPSDWSTDWQSDWASMGTGNEYGWFSRW